MPDSLFSTGAVGPVHRAVMQAGHVVAVAESSLHAAAIVRALNNEGARRATAQRLVVMRDQIENLLIDLDQGKLDAQGEIIKRVRSLLSFDPRQEESWPT